MHLGRQGWTGGWAGQRWRMFSVWGEARASQEQEDLGLTQAAVRTVDSRSPTAGPNTPATPLRPGVLQQTCPRGPAGQLREPPGR